MGHTRRRTRKTKWSLLGRRLRKRPDLGTATSPTFKKALPMPPRTYAKMMHRLAALWDRAVPLNNPVGRGDWSIPMTPIVEA